ncbi:hypothetical protein [Enterococcus termitis]|uniref:Major capsid protein n=1 Tax=Enterococcus termitis TaxID=332950 RepID=A0A1E5GZP8_9ENTE|nr:hypothetical protein [Enterococcus termitis]OEG18153.1 hypothetical protein BCR25_16805 [Enterococcus termitis]OJG97183.1 hypothetical protein RV18_GL001048 [Enterococcus termitis]
MPYQILGNNELTQKEDGSYGFELDGQTNYNSRAMTLGRILTPESGNGSNSNGLIPLKGRGDIEAYSVLSNQYIPLTKYDEINGVLDLHGYATREYTDGLSYKLSSGLVLSSAAHYRSAINKKFDYQAIFGIDEDPVYNLQGTIREPNSVFAKAKKNAATGFSSQLKAILDAVDIISDAGGQPTVMLQSLSMFELNEFTALIPGEVWTHATSDALFVKMPGMRELARLTGFTQTGDTQPWIVFDRSRLFVGKVGDVSLEISNSAYDPHEGFTGNTGTGAYNSPASSTGVSYWTNDKIGARAIAYLDYKFIDESGELAYTNLSDFTPTP